MSIAERAIELLKASKCPNCDGSGAVVVTTARMVPECCGNRDSDGSCCGNPVPGLEPHYDSERCEWCGRRDELLAEYEAGNGEQAPHPEPSVPVGELRYMVEFSFCEGFEAGRSAGLAGILAGDGINEWLVSRSRKYLAKAESKPTKPKEPSDG